MQPVLIMIICCTVKITSLPPAPKKRHSGNYRLQRNKKRSRLRKRIAHGTASTKEGTSGRSELDDLNHEVAGELNPVKQFA